MVVIGTLSDVQSIFKEKGYALARRALSPRVLSRLELEAVTQLDLWSSNASKGRRREWVPLLVNGRSLAERLFFSRALTNLAEELLGGPCAGVMVDANRLCVDTDRHADAPAPLRGLRFNLYLTRTSAGRGSLRLYPGSHRFAQMHEERNPVAPFVANVAPGDVIAMDLGLEHETLGTKGERLFLSFFYYALPTTPDGRRAIRNSIDRNLRAPAHFLKHGGERVGLTSLETIARNKPEWASALDFDLPRGGYCS